MHDASPEPVYDRILAAGAIEPGDSVVVVGEGAAALIPGVLERIGDEGSVTVIEEHAEQLEALLEVCGDPRVSYLIGQEEVLPLPDATADAVLLHGAATEAHDLIELAHELGRVLRPGGRASLYEPDAASAAGTVEQGFGTAGLGQITTTTSGGGLFASAVKQ